jgi:hypothetical protein
MGEKHHLCKYFSCALRFEAILFSTKVQLGFPTSLVAILMGKRIDLAIRNSYRHHPMGDVSRVLGFGREVIFEFGSSVFICSGAIICE